MKILGIIAEYNPFHLGHLYHLKKSQSIVKPDFTVAVMSGNFTQRGEIAIVDKWIRTEAALKNGIDLILELPVVFAVQSAELFAYGGIQTLNSTGCVTHISFGSEIDDLKTLGKVARVLVDEDPVYVDLLKGYVKKGLSFPSARSRALIDYFNDYLTEDASKELNKILESPNSILAIEYLKALYRTNSSICPVVIERIISDYHSSTIKKGISSATAIRNEIFKDGLNDKVIGSLPSHTTEGLRYAFHKNMGPVSIKPLENLILGLLRISKKETIKELVDVSEGLENRIKECAAQSSSLDQFLDLLKTKRYVFTRLQRILFYSLLGLNKTSFRSFLSNGGPQYLRILGFSERAKPLLKIIKDSATVPVITKAAHYSRYSQIVQEMFSYDCLATDLFSLAVPNMEKRKAGRDFTENVIIYK